MNAGLGRKQAESIVPRHRQRDALQAGFLAGLIVNHLPLEAAPLGALAYISVFASVFGFLFWNRGVAVVGPNTAGLFIHLMPVFGVALSVVLLGEEIAPYHLIGASLVFLGIAGASLHQTDTPLTKQEAKL